MFWKSLISTILLKKIFFISTWLCVFFFFNFIYLFIWLRWVFVAARGLSLVAASRGYALLRCSGFSLRWLLLLRSTGSRRAGFSSCGSRAQWLWLVGSRAQPQYLWRTGLVAPRHVRYSRTRDWTRVPCIGRRTPNHWATREAPLISTILNSGFFKGWIKIEMFWIYHMTQHFHS